VGADAAIAAGLAHQGSLATESAIYLFALAAAVQATGRLTLTPEGRSFALTFRRGTVEHAASSDPHDDLGSFLVRKGALKPETLLRAEAGKAARGGDLASTLIAERLVNPADVASFLQEHGTQLVQRALVSEGGGWSWSPDAAPPPDAFPLGAPLAMLCAAVRTLDAATLMRRLGDREQRVPSRIGGRIRIEDLRLTPQETRAAGLFDGSRTTREIAVASPTEALLVLRLAFLLGELELLAFGPARRSDPVPAPPAPPPGPAPTVAKIAATPPLRAPAPAPAGPTPTANPATIPNPAPSAKPAAPAAPPRPPVPSRPAAPVPASKPAGTPAPAAAPPKPALDRASLEALQTKLSGADHFAILGVKQDAAGGQIKAAYFQLAKAYHPDAIPADAAPEVKKLCADVFAKVSEAWSVLGEDALRAAYLEKLRSGGTAEVDVMNIFQAENLFQEGTLLVKGRKYDDAVRKFDEAMKLNPDEAEFGMWKAWCEFLLSDDRKKKVAPASSAIEVGLKKNPRCAQGYLFLGQMAKLAGDLTLAEKHLRRGLAVTPDHADLQRELKYLRK
jgi:curved DNA-binding protein CbpA